MGKCVFVKGTASTQAFRAQGACLRCSSSEKVSRFGEGNEQNGEGGETVSEDA